MRGVEYERAYEPLISRRGRRPHGTARRAVCASAGSSSRHTVQRPERDPPDRRGRRSPVVRDHLRNTTQAHNCTLGRGQITDPPETLAGGQLALLDGLAGRITHVHLIDSDGTLAEERFSNHIPFGEGRVDWDAVMPALVAAGSRDDWWTVDVCFRDNAWPVFEDGLPFVQELRERFSSNGRHS